MMTSYSIKLLQSMQIKLSYLYLTGFERFGLTGFLVESDLLGVDSTELLRLRLDIATMIYP